MATANMTVNNTNFLMIEPRKISVQPKIVISKLAVAMKSDFIICQVYFWVSGLICGRGARTTALPTYILG